MTGPVTFFGTTSMGENFTGTVSTMGGNPNAPLSFLGVTTTTPNDYVTNLIFSTPVGSNQSIIVDNVSIGTAIPEPTSMALFVVGSLVIGVGAIHRRARIKSVCVELQSAESAFDRDSDSPRDFRQTATRSGSLAWS